MSPRPKLAALVLAAGYSSRMGQFKPRLPVGGRSAIELAITAFEEAGIEDVVVVTGHRAPELTRVLEGQRVRCVFNPKYDSGMYSSIVAGLKALSPDTDACFILPADIPLVRPATIRQLAAGYRADGSPIVYPVFQSRRGHPPLVHRSLFAEFIADDGKQGLRGVLSRYEAQAATVSVLDEAIHLDMDTPADYARMNTLAYSRDVLSEAECEALLVEQHVPDEVVRHSRAVAKAAEKLAASLMHRGGRLNLALVRAGSLLHDMAKGQPDHAQVGERALERLGFPSIARIVAGHTDLDFRKRKLDEVAIVYLADKLVQGEEVVSLRRRFERALVKFRNDPRVSPIVRSRWQTAQCVARAVERRCRMRLNEILEQTGHAPSIECVPEEVVLGTTESVCPECLRQIAAQRIRENGDVYLSKVCPEHGRFKTIIWRGRPAYGSWAPADKRPSQPLLCATEKRRGCPFDCGLCSEHRQQTCCVLLEVTQRCNLGCPFCFAAAPQTHSDPSLETIEAWLRMLLLSGGPFNLQLSGGEPTMRDDLAAIIARARSMGFSFLQLNTNGIRLREDTGYLRSLKEAGLSCVFLQFDGVTEEVHEQIRGRRLLATKQEVIRLCREEGLGVVLVPTLVPGVNTGQIGDIIRLAIGEMPTVRAVHFQPVSYFGRYPATPANHDRITLPEVMRQIEQQTQGKIRAADFYPPSAENAYCSFQGKFLLAADGALHPAPRPKQTACCASVAPELVQLSGPLASSGQDSRRAREFVARQWSLSTLDAPLSPSSLVDVESLDAFLRDVQSRTLSISGMAFQDAWNLDLQRLRECFIHIVSPDRKLVPLCAYNLTDSLGHPLYRATDRAVPGGEVAHA